MLAQRRATLGQRWGNSNWRGYMGVIRGFDSCDWVSLEPSSPAVVAFVRMSTCYTLCPAKFPSSHGYSLAVNPASELPGTSSRPTSKIKNAKQNRILVFNRLKPFREIYKNNTEQLARHYAPWVQKRCDSVFFQNEFVFNRDLNKVKLFWWQWGALLVTLRATKLLVPMWICLLKCPPKMLITTK